MGNVIKLTLRLRKAIKKEAYTLVYGFLLYVFRTHQIGRLQSASKKHIHFSWIMLLYTGIHGRLVSLVDHDPYVYSYVSE